MQKTSLIHTLILKTQQILASHELNKWPRPFLTSSTQKPVKWLLAFLNLQQHAKISLFHQFILEIQSILNYVTRLVTPTFDHSHTKFFDQLLIYGNLYQHAKNLTISPFGLEIWLIKIWLWYFDLYLKNKKNSQIWDLWRNTANNLNFHQRKNSVNPFLVHFYDFEDK